MNPDLYHGKKKRKNFFEGWYFKICDAEDKEVFAFIPGIAMGRNSEEAHSFVQILDGNEAKYRYCRFKRSDFMAAEDKFYVEVGNNKFSNENIELDIDQRDLKISGNIRINNSKGWPGSLLNPGSMGFYNYLWFMECYSQVCRMNGELEGEIVFNGKRIDLNGGKVYIEKNWGSSFPESWIWLQSNSFKDKRISFTCSIGKVPFMHTSFSGFLVGLQLKEKFYAFTTINRSKMKIIQSGNDVELEFIRKDIILKIKSRSNPDFFMTCLGPKDGEMIPLVDENLKGEVEVQLMNIKTGEIIFDGIGLNCGIEYGGKALQERNT